MGLLFVLIFRTVIGGVLSLVGGLILGGLVAYVTRGVGAGRSRAIGIARAAADGCHD